MWWQSTAEGGGGALKEAAEAHELVPERERAGSAL
jgi:hypothetical protein